MKNKFLVNEQITAPYILLVEEGLETKEYTLRDALKLAASRGLDLVQVSSDPAVCKILDYQKFLFQRNKQTNTASKKATSTKDIQIGLFSEEHDFQVKIHNAIRLLTKGYRVRIVVVCRGRQFTQKDKAPAFVQRILSQLEGQPIVIDKTAVQDGARRSVAEIIIRPKK